MKWKNLKDMKCPQCDEDLKLHGEQFDCSRCEFSIGKKKFEDLVVALYKVTPRRSLFNTATDDERHAEWNNYKHDEQNPGRTEE